MSRHQILCANISNQRQSPSVSCIKSKTTPYYFFPNLDVPDEPVQQARRQTECAWRTVAEDAEKAKAGDGRVSVRRRDDAVVGGAARESGVDLGGEGAELLARVLDLLVEGVARDQHLSLTATAVKRVRVNMKYSTAFILLNFQQIAF